MESDKAKQNLILKGISVSDGIGIGTVNVYHTDLDDIPEYTIEANAMLSELERYYAAINEVKLIFLHSQRRAAREFGTKYSQIYEAYHLILEDLFFQEEIPETMRSMYRNAESVILQKLVLYEKHFENVKDEYLRERIYDIRGVSRRVIFHLLQSESNVEFKAESANLIFASELTPADSIHFHQRSLKGIVTEFGGSTSHAAILARTLEVPAIVGIGDLLKKVNKGDTAIVAGTEGLVILRPDAEVIKDYKSRLDIYKKNKRKLLKSVDRPVPKLDDREFILQANINDESEVPLAKKYNAEGVGLLRTEFKFIAREALLTETEQYTYYKEILSAFPQQEVVIRVLDIGGDKFLPFAPLHHEQNPFLGWRSIRILLQEKDIFKTQLRAIFRAAIYGNAKLLIPMISNRSEVVATKRVIEEVKQDLISENVAFKDNIPFGIMVEIPSAAIMIDQLIKEVDFVSIGTNDLIQYTLAVDRNNERVAEYYQPLNPAVLRLIKSVADAGRENGKPVSLCGELAGNPLYTLMLLSFKIDRLSMHPGALPHVKNIIIHADSGKLAEIEKEVLNFNDPESLESYLKEQLNQLF